MIKHKQTAIEICSDSTLFKPRPPPLPIFTYQAYSSCLKTKRINQINHCYLEGKPFLIIKFKTLELKLYK